MYFRLNRFPIGMIRPPSSEDSDRVQIVERLAWTPKQRLDYLVDMIAFEERAHQARRLG